MTKRPSVTEKAVKQIIQDDRGEGNRLWSCDLGEVRSLSSPKPKALRPLAPSRLENRLIW